ncbi:glucosaminylphosphatidylinositol acyltransferase [Nematocida minor]|uniref:glucosaminylphosphatidylinositol acyltransferase n=1 Tax=Nematocida minor TaxID=1912983 RepID=UPI00221F3EB4|nr:glucosaminylphosphatidylinositol acyltransferase [Nematocida minor]KAI5190029.1 glucosaminylphosphatidylinositol acyltransferase [Nematocida minor]
MFITTPAYPRAELLHTTCCSIYWLIIVDYFKIENFWVLLSGICTIHYIVSATRSVLISQVLLFSSAILFLIKSASVKKYTYNQKDTGHASLIIDGLRYIVCSLVCISIFMCDFPFYPSYKLKSTYFGISLMDFGVVAFMLNAGMISSVSHKFRLKKSIYMGSMGLIRLGVILSGYHSDPTEYGTHLNFYFVYLLSENLSLLFKHFDPLTAGLSILLAHEAVINQKSVIDFVFFETRENLFKANREGLISVLPYTGVLLLGKAIGKIIFAKDQTLGRTLHKLTLMLCFLFAMHFGFLHVLQPSRRLCSLSFTSFCCGAMVLPMCIFYGISCIYQFCNIKFLSNLSRVMGPMFLLANVYVLIGNIIFDWKSYSIYYAHLSNILYMILLFGIPVGLYRRHTLLQSDAPRKTKVSSSSK